MKLTPDDLPDLPEEESTVLPEIRLSDDAAYYVEIISDLLKSKHYEWARENLEGIAKTITQSGELTARQRQAVDRTIAGRLRHDLG